MSTIDKIIPVSIALKPTFDFLELGSLIFNFIVLADTLEQGASTLYSITSNLVGDGPVSKTLGGFF